MRNDETYLQLLCVLPTTPQREYLQRQLAKNRPSMMAEPLPQLKDIKRGQVLLVFYDPDCEHCKKMMPGIKAFAEKHAEQMTTVYVNVMTTPEAEQGYYLPALPALYLLDEEGRVKVKDGRLEVIRARSMVVETKPR